MLKFDELNLEKCADGLLPVVVQDAVTLKGLMVGYMNREAYDKTIAEGRVTFYSRSRECLWTKGETSGNFLTVKDVYIDCDKDTILARVEQVGAACHTENRTCFYTKITE